MTSDNRESPPRAELSNFAESTVVEFEVLKPIHIQKSKNMELPSLGKHCAEQTCKQLDFLPMKCDACHDIFCKDHFTYTSHSCTEAYKKNNRVPECPLCSKPIPIRPGKTADEEVGRHVDSDCQSDPAKERRGKVYSNRCNNKGCRKKELVPFTCDKCLKNFCISHRHQLDHDCKGFENTGRQGSRAAAAAINRATKVNDVSQTKVKKPHGVTQQPKITSFVQNQEHARSQPNPRSATSGNILGHYQGSMTEEEAIAQAIALSLGNTTESATSSKQQQEDEDFALAQAIAKAEEERLKNSPQGRTIKVSS